MSELPPLDVTDVERTAALALTEEEWLTQYAMASPIELLAIRYCRERQLLQALRERDDARKMRDEHFDEIVRARRIISEQISRAGKAEAELAAANRRADEAEKAIREHNVRVLECEQTQFIIPTQPEQTKELKNKNA